MNNKLKKTAKCISDFVSDFLDGDFNGLSAEISFYLLSAFFPMIIMIFTAVPYISLNYNDVIFKIFSVLPHQLENLLRDLFTSPARGTIIITTTGIFTLFTVSGMINTIEKALHRFYGIENNRSYITSKIISLCFSVLIFISIIASFGLIIFGTVIGDILHTLTSDKGIQTIWNASRYIIILVYIIMVFSALYKAMPNKKIKLRTVIPGAAFTTLAWYTSSMLFALYVNNFPQYEIIYGSLAGFMCLIMWVYLTGLSIVAGAKINGMLYRHSQKKKNKQDELENTIKFRINNTD